MHAKPTQQIRESDATRRMGQKVEVDACKCQDSEQLARTMGKDSGGANISRRVAYVDRERKHDSTRGEVAHSV